MDFFSKSWKSRFSKKGGVPPVGSVRGGTPPKSAALSNVWIGASNVKSDMVPIRNTTRKKKSENPGVRFNLDFFRTFGYFRHDFDDFRKNVFFEKSEKVAHEVKIYKISFLSITASFFPIEKSSIFKKFDKIENFEFFFSLIKLKNL